MVGRECCIYAITNSGWQNKIFKTASKGVYYSVTEAFNSGDQYSIQAAFIASIVERVAIIEQYFQKGWISVDDEQTTSWNAVNDTAAASWISVNDAQSNKWTVVSDVIYSYNIGMMLGGAAFGDDPLSSLGSVATVVTKPCNNISITQPPDWVVIDDSQ